MFQRLKKMQRRERERMEGESYAAGEYDSAGRPNPSEDGGDAEGERRGRPKIEDAEGGKPLPQRADPDAERGLLIESLAMNHHESIEGMAKCYDRIVSS